MSDQPENPLNKEESPLKYEEAYYTDDEARALYDTYMMLRDYGLEPEDLVPLMFAIEKLTIYDGVAPESLRLWLKIEDVE